MTPFVGFVSVIALLAALAGMATPQTILPRHRFGVTTPQQVSAHHSLHRNPGSQWTPLTNQLCTTGNPCFPAGVAMLLTDGSVLVHEEQDGNQQNWFKLTPDIFGSYVNGTWSQVASIPPELNYSPLFFGSSVIADSRVTVIGGEVNFQHICLDQPGCDLRPRCRHMDERSTTRGLDDHRRCSVDQSC